MNKQSIFNHFAAIIDNMLDNSLFFETYFQNCYSLDNIIGSVDDAAVPENISIRFGVSRGCIIDDNYNYVVKFDIEGDSLDDSLCQREMDIYSRAKARNLNNYFAEPIYLGTYSRTIQFYDYYIIERNMDWCDYDPINFEEEFIKNEDNFGNICPITISIPLYAYPRAEVYQYTMFSDKDSERYKSEARSINSPLKKRHLQIAMEFVFRYGMEEYERLSDFLDDFHVNDLHYGNVGKIDNVFSLIDYAGWHTDYSDEYGTGSY